MLSFCVPGAPQTFTPPATSQAAAAFHIQQTALPSPPRHPTPSQPPPCAARNRKSRRPQRRAPPAGCLPQTGRRRTRGGRAAGASACAPHTPAAAPLPCRRPGSCGEGHRRPGVGDGKAARVQSERRHVYRRTVQAVAHQNKPPHQASAQPHLTATAMSRRVSTICAPVKSRWPSCNSAGWGGGSSQKVWQPALSREWGSSQQHQRPPVCGLPSGFHELLVPAPCAPYLPGSAAGL